MSAFLAASPDASPSAGSGRSASVPARRRPVPRYRGAVLTIAAAALLPFLAAGPAHAVGSDKQQEKEKQPRPPAKMSAVGGQLLSRPGTQVKLGPGAPKLPKKLSGRSWVVADAESGEVLAAHNAHWKLPPASTLKMLFADTVLPKLPKDYEYKVDSKDLEGMGEGSSTVGIKEHLTYSVHDLWLGVFLRSGNDAVHVLTAINGGQDKTVQEMQQHADELNATDTHVVTPDGYDAKGQVSSAYDLTLFARSGLQNADFREYCSTASAQFPGEVKKDKKTKKSKRESFAIQNTNRLLTGDFGLDPYEGLAGVKNGYTSHAGSTFTGVAQRGDRVLLVTVMNPSENGHDQVYKETASLLDWGFKAAGKVEPVGELVAPKGTGQEQAGRDSGGAAEREDHAKASVASPADDSGGMWTAVGLIGGVLVALGAGILLVHRRWPLPDLVRRRPRGAQGPQG
ncbi:D-alanyl-D-alanine carboxypeptidase family protein [Streptomyces pathocidini]|uniref:D-alanyl-D-alanine carboxypeptidase family protein n=1 Tax=Streptomyces pathocidini TaxID=1650571 RepID=UPI003F4CD04A